MPQFYAKTWLPHNPRKTFILSADQPIKFVANVAIQVAQPQICHANPSQVAIDMKSSMRRRVFEAIKNHLGVDITGINLFDAIGQLRPSAPSASKSKTSLGKGEIPFKFTSSTKVIKPSAILKSLSPPPPPPSSTNKVVPKQPKPSSV